MSYREESGSLSHYFNTTGRETTHTYKYLKFNTRYTFEVWTRFIEGDVLGEGAHVVNTTEPFTAPVGPLSATEHSQTTLVLSWSAPHTIDVKRSLKVTHLVISTTIACAVTFESLTTFS